MSMKTYDVHRSMHGDGKDYEPGDTRELDEADAKHLVDLGALALEGEEPRVREPAVLHTYGAAEPTGHLDTVNAGAEASVKLVKPAKAAGKPAA